MKPLKIILLFAGLLLLVCCEKESPDSLHGRWDPVYASGVCCRLLSGMVLVLRDVFVSRRTMGIMGSLPDAGFSSLRASQSSAVSAWTFSIVNPWLTLPTT